MIEDKLQVETVQEELKNWISINPYYAECPYCGQLRFRRDEGWSYCPHCGNKTTGKIRA
jgi:Zn finger protein HypA/HybF involved in hydrogenase expression